MRSTNYYPLNTSKSTHRLSGKSTQQTSVTPRYEIAKTIGGINYYQIINKSFINY